MSAKKLETAVTETLMSKVLTIDFVGRLVDKINEKLSDTDKIKQKIADEEKRLGQVERKIQNLIKSIEDGQASNLLNEQLAKRELERNSIHSELSHLEARLNQAGRKIDSQTVFRLLTSVKETLTRGELKARQEVIKRCVQRIDVSRNEATLHCTFNFDVVWFMPPTGFEPVSQP